MERDSFDLVVVGGGITGAGVALDAASRGYSVALVEKSDFAAGTSSRSSKLDPRRPSLPPELRPRPGARGAARALAAGEARAAPRAAAAVHRPDVRGQAPRPHARHGAQHVRRDVVAPRPRPRRGGGVEPGAPPHDRRRRGARLVPALAGARAHRRLPLLRLPDRRRAARADRARRGRALRRGDREPLRGHGARRARRPRRRRARAATASAAASSSCAPTTW